MRIAYVIYWVEGFESGVIKKIRDQSKYWLAANHQVKLYVLTSKDSEFHKDFSNRSFGVETQLIVFKGRFDMILKSYELCAAVTRDCAHLVYMREISYLPGIYRLVRRVKTIVELNSLSQNELTDFSVRKLYSWTTKELKFRNVQGFVSVTNEILRRVIGKDVSKPSVVIGNSIDLSGIKSSKKQFAAKGYNLLFIGTQGQIWHGVDKMLELAKIKEDWNFHIIGIDKRSFKGCVLKNTIFYGNLARDEYIDIFFSCDVAFGTLALHRKGMTEACPLKVREYLAYGLPVIIGYNDIDFPDSPNFLCKLPNEESNVVNSAELIEEFIRYWKGKRVSYNEVKHLDISFKETKRLDFFDKVVDFE